MKTFTCVTSAFVLICSLVLGAPKEREAVKIIPEGVYRLEVKGVPKEEKQKWDKEYRIDKEGRIDLPIGKKLHIGGLMLPQAEHKLQKHLKDQGIFLNPTIHLWMNQDG